MFPLLKRNQTKNQSVLFVRVILIRIASGHKRTTDTKMSVVPARIKNPVDQGADGLPGREFVMDAINVHSTF